MASRLVAGKDPVARSLAERDLECVWHPFTQAKSAPPPIAIVRGAGTSLYSDTGASFLDMSSSWWVNLHGHCHPYIAEKIAEQARRLEHVLFAGYTHPPAVELAERLLQVLGPEYGRIFYSDNGSTAVETALKIALQASGPNRKLLSFKNGYHGDTFGAMSVAGKGFSNEPFWSHLFEVRSIEPPVAGREEASWRAFEEAVGAGDVAAFVFEPLIQGWGGILRLHSAEMLARMVAACHARGILTIADEVLTGFGRTGPLFAFERLGVAPDMVCLAKGLTGGFLPLGATAVKPFVFEAFLSDEFSKAFLHGHSYTANPLGCAAASASLDLLLRPDCAAARERIERSHGAFRARYGSHPKLLRCEVLGTILILEYRAEASSYFHPIRQRLLDFFHERGILLRPFGNIVSIFPPYCATASEMDVVYAALGQTLEWGEGG